MRPASNTAISAGVTEYAKPITSRLNPTGRAITMAVPLKDGAVVLGEVMVRILTDDTLLVSKAELRERLKGALAGGAGAALDQVAETSGFIALSALESAGVRLRFDAGLQELQLALAVEQRPTNDISLHNKPVQPSSASLADPAKISGYVNVTAGLDHAWSPQSAASGGATSGRLEFDSALRLHGAVFENKALYEGEVDANVCPTGAQCVYQHAAGLKRQSSRMIYDNPEAQLRFELGDTDAVAGSLQRSVEMLGVSVEKSANKLTPGESTASSARTVLRIERPSEIDVTVNGVTVQHLRLQPGTYNLRDLPLVTGANEVKLNITDDLGARHTEKFTTFSAFNQLAAGKSEWAATAGVPSFTRDDGRNYQNKQYAATSYLRYGLTDKMTGEVNLQGDERVVMGAAGASTATPFGIFGLQGASSAGAWGTGFAADANWDLTNYSGILAERGESLHLAAEYRSSAFHRPGDFNTAATGILYPEFNYWLRLSGSFSATVGDGIGLGLSGRYQFADSKQALLSPYTVSGNRYGADLTLSRALGASASASLLLGYSNESYLRGDLNQSIANTKPDFRIGLRFNFRPDEKTTVSTGYDSLNRQATASAYRSEGNGIGRWDTNVDVQQLGYANTANANGALGYYGNRGEMRLAYNGDATEAGSSKFSPQAGTQRVSARGSTSIAFADGMVAIGPPIRGNAFAIVSPHESIAGKEITVGDMESPRAKADGWGPAVVADLPAYAPSNVPVDVADLPVGYSLGAGAFDLRPPYKAGYALEVGSAYSVSVFGTLLDAQGEAVALMTGFAHPVDRPTKRVSIFTNASGKFGAEGLAAGRWILEMATEGPALQFVVDVPKGTDGLFKAGTLRPLGARAP